MENTLHYSSTAMKSKERHHIAEVFNVNRIV